MGTSRIKRQARCVVSKRIMRGSNAGLVLLPNSRKADMTFIHESVLSVG
jgi:hypothetical protein